MGTSVTRKQLKLMLKECIKELLEEGAFDAPLKEVLTEANVINNQQVTAADFIQQPQAQVPQYLNQINEGTSVQYQQGGFAPQQPQQGGRHPQQPMTQYAQQKNHDLVRQAAVLTGGKNGDKSSLMESIFADTMAHSKDPELAKVTGRQVAASPEQIQQDQNELQALAAIGGKGADMSRWAKIAAASYQKKQ